MSASRPARLVPVYITRLRQPDCIVTQGPGDNSSLGDPYLVFTGRTYNDTPVPGVMRVKQGTLCLKLVQSHRYPRLPFNLMLS